RLALAGGGAAGGGAHRSLLGRAVAAWIREAVAEERAEPGGRADVGRAGDPGPGGRAENAVREPEPVN
ncbi:hypothetical protein, partial [Nonomuraea sp. NPDC050691]|uniref:hypothetical protein n=1 Tax=Nonomuraea sp. NPDC050691 TaxID=3155661 RepID=UPI0033DEFA74